MPDTLRFRRVTGEPAERVVSSYGPQVAAGDYLLGRIVRFDDGLELRQHRPTGGSQRIEGYERLDNEILAGRRLYTVADWTYPTQVTRLHGDEAASAEPYALFESYQGRPLREVGLYMGDDEFEAFLTSFLTGMCWIAAAGVAHQTISQDTVLWDSQRGALITDFSRSTVFGGPRTKLSGYAGWVPRELRPGLCSGTVGPRDDLWAAGRLIFFVRNQGEELTDRRQIADLDALFNGMFDRVLGPAEGRPTAQELLEDGLKRRSGAPSAAERGERLRAGRESFLAVRQRKYPSAAVPPDLNADLDWAGGSGDRTAAPVNGRDPAVPQAPGADGPAADTTIPADGWPQETARPRRFPRRRGVS